MPKQLVIHDHDGGLDDFLALALLLTMPDVEVRGVVVTPADCYIEPAVSVTRKLLDVMERSAIPVAESTVRGLNPFPREWRQSTFVVDHFPMLNDRDEIQTPLVAEGGQHFLARLLASAEVPVTLCVTGPLTTVAAALDLDATITSKIKEIVWMGGALNVPGNVDPIQEANHDGSAEWNVFWDPPAARQIWETPIPIILCPLDITNHAPVTSALVKDFGRERQHPLMEFAALCYGSVMKQGGYYFWDVLTAAYIGRPDLFTLRAWETELIATGRSAGRTKVQPGGRVIQALETVDLDGFYAYLLKQWRGE